MAGGLAAGMIDFARLDEAVVPHAMRHMAAVGLAWLGYGVALYLRRESLWASGPVAAPTVAVSVISACILHSAAGSAAGSFTRSARASRNAASKASYSAGIGGS